MLPVTKPLIYAVDDDADEHFLLERVFSRHHTDCTLRCFSDGAELITQLTHRLDGRLPNLILLDWHMPILGGYQVLQLLRGDADWRTIPVVVRSSSQQFSQINGSYDSGAKAFIIKASTYRQLADSVQSLRGKWLGEVASS